HSLHLHPFPTRRSSDLDAATAVRGALDGLGDWGLAGTRPGQYHSDLAADGAALAVLEEAGLGVLSEESGVTGGERDLLVVLDPRSEEHTSELQSPCNLV